MKPGKSTKQFVENFQSANAPKPLDLEILEEVVELFKTSILKNYNEARFNKEDIEFVILLTKKIIKQRIKSACEFYLRYKNRPFLLKKEQKDLIVIEFAGIKLHDIDKTEVDLLFERRGWDDFDLYNEWLFELAFKEVFKES